MARASARSDNPGDRHGSYSRSFRSSSPLAEASIARDLADYADDEGSTYTTDGERSEASTIRQISSQGYNSHSLVGSYRRPSFFTVGSRGTVVPHQLEQDRLTRREREQAIQEERNLLSANNLIGNAGGLKKKPSGDLSVNSSVTTEANYLTAASVLSDESPIESREPPPLPPPQDTTMIPTENTALLGTSDLPNRDGGKSDDIDRKWEEAVAAGLIQTTWRREVRVVGKYTAPLVLTFLLQYSLTVSSILTIGHLGKVELGAVSLAGMTANITGFAVYQGLATSLDTLCAQAYGSGKKKLVGLQMQRMVYFLWLMTIPIVLVWFFADKILMRIVPEKDVATLAGLYLKVAAIGTPGYACFESGKRYMQAQGLFSAPLYILLICAPLNAFMNWLFVWRLGWGFTGAPIAVAITEILLPFCLFLYVYLVAGSECWPGFTCRALQNWGSMIRLALPGLIMVEAEYLAFELMTLASSYLGTTTLAAQSVLSTITSITYQIPFPVSIAASTRIANLIGATLTDAARTAAKASMSWAVVVGLFNMIMLSSLRYYIPRLFAPDEDVIEIIAQVLPLCAAFQLFDALTATCNGILRGLGRQKIGGYIQPFCYYVVAMPIGMGTSFGLGWGLWGLWTGFAIAVILVLCIESVFLCLTNWQRSVEEARQRNAMG